MTLKIPDRETVTHALDDPFPPPRLEELRTVLLAEGVFAQKNGVDGRWITS